MAVEFNEENNFNQSFSQQETNSTGLSGWLIAKGIAKDESAAQAIMIGLIVICFGLAIFFFIRG